MQQPETLLTRLTNPNNTQYHQALRELEYGLGVDTITPGQAEHEALYTTTQTNQLTGVSRLLANPTPQKLISYDFNPDIQGNYNVGILAGAYVNPEFRSNKLRINGKSLARILSEQRIQDAWSGEYNEQGKLLDILITRCRQTSSPMYENNENFLQIGGWTDNNKGALTYHISTRPGSNLDINELANEFYIGPNKQLKRAI